MVADRKPDSEMKSKTTLFADFDTHLLDKLVSRDKETSLQRAVWRNGGSNPAENVVEN